MIKGDVLNPLTTKFYLYLGAKPIIAVGANKFSDKHVTMEHTIIYPPSRPHRKIKGSCLKMNISISMCEYQIVYVEVVTMAWRIQSLKHEPFLSMGRGGD